MANCMEMFKQKLQEKKFVCVGLDPQWDKMPKHLTGGDSGRGPRVKDFVTSIIYETRDVACAYKANLWFYLAEGLQGLWALQESINFAKGTAPNVPVGLDMKVGDIGSTTNQAAKFAFDSLGVDFITVNPWGGRKDGIDSFLKYNDKGIFVWCSGSNEGSEEFQNLVTFPPNFNFGGGLLEAQHIGVHDLRDWLHALRGYSERMTERVASRVSKKWNAAFNCGLVIGATKPGDLSRIRKLVGDLPILIPGIGAQAGDLDQAVRNAIYTNPETTIKSFPAIINSSSSIIYASNEKDFAEATKGKTVDLNSKILAILEQEGALAI